MGSGSRNRVERWERRTDFAVRCCYVTPSEQSPVMLNYLSLNNYLLSLSAPMNELLLCRVMEKSLPQRADTRRPQAGGRISCPGGSREVKVQIKRKFRNAYEEREDSGGKDELITLIPTKLY